MNLSSPVLLLVGFGLLWLASEILTDWFKGRELKFRNKRFIAFLLILLPSYAIWTAVLYASYLQSEDVGVTLSLFSYALSLIVIGTTIWNGSQTIEHKKGMWIGSIVAMLGLLSVFFLVLS